MPRYTAAPRAKRRRSCFRSTCCCLLLAGAVIFLGLNLARILASEINLHKVPKVTETPRPPNYYERIGVSPMISEQDLKVAWKKYNLKNHPDKRTSTAPLLDEAEDYLQKKEMFKTLLSGVRRCEYDEEHRIKGRWRATTCKQAFPEVYRARLDEDLEVALQEIQEAKVVAESGGRKIKVKVEAGQQKPLEAEAEEQQPLKVEIKQQKRLEAEAEEQQPLKVEIKQQKRLEAEAEEQQPLKVEIKQQKVLEVEVEKEKQQPLTTESAMKASSQARPAVPVVTVELGPEPEDGITDVDSIPGFKALKSSVADVWTNGIVHSWIQLKAVAADCTEKVFSALASWTNNH